MCCTAHNYCFEKRLGFNKGRGKICDKKKKRTIESIANPGGKVNYDVKSDEEQISGFLHITVKSIGKS